jgi:hypothetical protein
MHFHQAVMTEWKTIFCISGARVELHCILGDAALMRVNHSTLGAVHRVREVLSSCSWKKRPGRKRSRHQHKRPAVALEFCVRESLCV